MKQMKKWVNDDKGRINAFKRELAELYMEWNLSLVCKEGSIVVEQYNQDHIDKYDVSKKKRGKR